MSRTADQARDVRRFGIALLSIAIIHVWRNGISSEPSSPTRLGVNPVQCPRRYFSFAPLIRIAIYMEAVKSGICIRGPSRITRALFISSPTSTRSSLDIEVDEEDQDLISPANGPPANGPAIPPIIPETTQATTTSTFVPWRTSRRTTGKNLPPSEKTLDNIAAPVAPIETAVSISSRIVKRAGGRRTYICAQLKIIYRPVFRIISIDRNRNIIRVPLTVAIFVSRRLPVVRLREDRR